MRCVGPEAVEIVVFAGLVVEPVHDRVVEVEHEPAAGKTAIQRVKIPPRQLAFSPDTFALTSSEDSL